MERGMNRTHIEVKKYNQGKEIRGTGRSEKKKESSRIQSQNIQNRSIQKQKRKQQRLRGSSQRVVVFGDSQQVISMQAEIVREYHLSCTSPGIVVVFTGITTRLLLLLLMVTKPTPNTFTE